MFEVLKLIQLLQNLTKFNCFFFPGVWYAANSQSTKVIAALNKIWVPKSYFEDLEHTLRMSEL